MKIVDLKATPVAVPLKVAETTSKMRKGPNVTIAVIVQVYTDEGYVGIGESPVVLGADLTTAIINTTKPLIVGKDPRNINQLMKELYVYYNLTHLHIHVGNWAFSGIELALWDIMAQISNMPLYCVWGGAFRKYIEMQGTIERQELDGITEAARQLAAAGYKSLYIKVGFDPDEDIAAVAAIRKGAPDSKVKIRVDANQAWSTGIAVSTINKMSEYGIEWVEQPTIMYNLDALRDVKNAVDVPILGHESNWTMYDLINVIKHNAVDYVKLDGRFDAGYYGVRISAGIAEAAGIQCMHHSFFQLGIALAGSLHVIASCPNFSIASSMGEYAGLLDDIIVGGPLQMKKIPYMELPSTPGIGVRIDEERLVKYNELYIKEVFEKGFERQTEKPYYTAMFMRPYFKDVLD